MLIVISGLPATGKTTLAAALSRHVGAVHLSVDSIEDAMLRAGLAPGWTTGVAAYESVGAAAHQNLVLGRVVVVDAVNDSDAARQTWRDAAGRAEVEVRFVWLLPPASAEHQRRLSGRTRGFGHVGEPSWEQVVARAEAYEPWRDEPIELSSEEPVEELIRRLEPALALGNEGERSREEGSWAVDEGS
jgi:predicted kinase